MVSKPFRPDPVPRDVTNKQRLVAGALLALALVALTPVVLVSAALHDAAAPVEIARVLPIAKEQLDNNHSPIRWPLTHYRYVSTESRATDNLVVLHFEFRTYPFITTSSAYLASRCTPLEQIDPQKMSGGWGSESTGELEYLRSRAQPACP